MKTAATLALALAAVVSAKEDCGGIGGAALVGGAVMPYAGCGGAALAAPYYEGMAYPYYGAYGVAPVGLYGGLGLYGGYGAYGYGGYGHRHWGHGGHGHFHRRAEEGEELARDAELTKSPELAREKQETAEAAHFPHHHHWRRYSYDRWPYRYGSRRFYSRGEKPEIMAPNNAAELQNQAKALQFATAQQAFQNAQQQYSQAQSEYSKAAQQFAQAPSIAPIKETASSLKPIEKRQANAQDSQGRPLAAKITRAK